MCEYYYGFPLEACHDYALYILNNQAQTYRSQNQDSRLTHILALKIHKEIDKLKKIK